MEIMRVGVNYGLEHQEFEVVESKGVRFERQSPAPPLSNLAAAVEAALETPHGFPALRRALTPDDHVAIVVDEHLPHLPELLVPIFEHVGKAGVSSKRITLLCPPSDCSHDWRDELPAVYHDVAMEFHDRANRKRLSYLATTRRGRRLYINRTAVDADQLIVLARRGYDPLLGYSGSEGLLFPGLSDEATCKDLATQLTAAVPGKEPWPVQREAEEVAWLLGAPFMLQVIEGAGNELTHILGGLADSGVEGQRLLNARWRITVDELADTVVAGISGNPAHHQFSDLASGLAAAARVVKPDGRIALLSQTNPTLNRGAEMLRQADDPEEALSQLHKENPPDMAAAFQWASAARHASLYLLSGIPTDTVEELFATPLERASQVQQLLSGDGTYLFLPDAHKTMAVLGKSAPARSKR
jgi:nickel-dependent lactate racemase